MAGWGTRLCRVSFQQRRGYAIWLGPGQNGRRVPELPFQSDLLRLCGPRRTNQAWPDQLVWGGYSRGRLARGVSAWSRRRRVLAATPQVQFGLRDTRPIDPRAGLVPTGEYLPNENRWSIPPS